MYIIDFDEQKKMEEDRLREDPDFFKRKEAEKQRKYEEALRESARYPRSPYELDPIIATLLYIVVMIGSLIFKDFLYIWMFASFLYWRKIYKMFH